MGISFCQAGYSYSGRPALKDIDLSLGQGITAVMGYNGSGKTTLLQLAAGILTPAQGVIALDGEPLLTAGIKLRRELGFLPQTVDFPEHLTPRKLLTYLAQLRFMSPKPGLAELERFGIAHLADRRFEELSLGEIRLVGIAQAFMGAPRFLLLDEFTRNLGIEDRQRVLCRLLELAPGRTILFSTHICEDVEALAERVILLSAGRIGFSGQPAALIRSARGSVFEGDAAQKQAVLACRSVQIDREINSASGRRLRIVGEPPAHLNLQGVEPTFEEACLWFFHHNKRKPV
jgi:ABC-2 type transport system ATP-binding protein